MILYPLFPQNLHRQFLTTRQNEKKNTKTFNYNNGSIRSVFFHVACSYAWENRHFAIPPVVSARNDLWGTRIADSASDWWKQISHAALPIRSTNQIWEATRHQYGIFALVSQTPASFRRESSGGVGGNVDCFHRLQIYWNKSQVQLPQDRFGTLKSPSFDCFEIQKGGRDVM